MVLKKAIDTGRMFLVASLMIVGAGGFSAPIVAQEPGKTIQRTCELEGDLGEFVVTATRTRAHLKRLPVPVRVVSRAEIEKIAPMSVKDLLVHILPGVEMSTHGNITHISIQGFDAKYFTFLVDGEEVAGLKNGSMDLLRLSPESVERIEIVRGAGSAMYGSSAIGGVINIITREAKLPLRTTLTAGYSHPRQISGYVQQDVRKESWSDSFSLSYDREGGYRIPNKDGSVSWNIPHNDVYRLHNKFGLSLSPIWSLKSITSGSYRHLHTNEFHGDRFSTATQTVKVAGHLSESSALTTTLNFDGSWRHRKFINTGRDMLLHHDLRGVGRVQYDYVPSLNHHLSIGVEGTLQRMRSDQIAQGAEVKYIGIGVLYAQHLWSVTPAFQLMTGIRGDYHSDFGLNLSPKLTASYRIGKLTTRAGIARAFRAPEIMELYFDWSHNGMFWIHGNPDLKPEISLQFLGGVEWISDKLTLSGNVTTSSIHNGIVRYQKSDDGDVYHANTERPSRLTVADARVTVRPLQGWTLHGMYSFSHAPKWIEHEGASVNIDRTRPHHWIARTDYYKGIGHWGFTSSFSLQYLSGISYDAITEDEDSTPKKEIVVHRDVPGYVYGRLSLSATYNQKHTLTVGADNLFNHHAEYLSYQNASLSPGCMPFARLTMRLP